MTRDAELNRMSDELVRHLDALARRFMLREKLPGDDAVSLTRQEFRMIGAIGDRRSCTMGELAGHMLLAVSTLPPTVDRLVAKDLATRERSSDDRRVVRVGLTARGYRWYAQRRRRRLRMARAMLGSLRETEQERFLALIRKIGRSVLDGEQGGR